MHPATAPVTGQAPTGSQSAGGPLVAARTPYVLAVAAALTALAAGGLTWLDPELLLGPDVMNGSARGTAVVVVLVAVPLLAGGSTMVAHGRVRGIFLWVGALAYLVYNAVLFLFATPYNRAFLLYVAMLATAAWGLIALLVSTDTDRVAAATGPQLPARPAAVFLWVVAGLNVLVWLRGIAPAVAGDPPAEMTDGMGVATNAVYVQDLAFWLPAAVLAALWLWQRRPWGELLAGSLLVFWTVECLGVAVDQWSGHHADPTSDLASAGGSVLFLVLAAVTAAMTAWFLARVDPVSPATGRRTRTRPV